MRSAEGVSRRKGWTRRTTFRGQSLCRTHGGSDPADGLGRGRLGRGDLAGCGASCGSWRTEVQPAPAHYAGTGGSVASTRTFDPEHLPEEILLTEAFHRRFPGLPQVACFDTAFHHDLPRVARLLPLPRRFDARGVRRYGFHGLSYAFLLEELARLGRSRSRPQAGSSLRTSGTEPAWRRCVREKPSIPAWALPRWRACR